MYPFVDIHTHRREGGEGITLRSHRLGIGEPVPEKPYSAGIHPWDVAKVADIGGALASLRRGEIAAVGECGLDKFHPAPELQEKVFRMQLDAAQELGLPVVVHNVRSFDRIVKILGGYSLRGVIFHGYTGSREQTGTAMKAGYYISLGEASLGSRRTVEGLEGFPQDRLFLETDDSPLGIAAVYERAAAVLDVGQEQLRERIYMNYTELFIV